MYDLTSVCVCVYVCVCVCVCSLSIWAALPSGQLCQLEEHVLLNICPVDQHLAYLRSGLYCGLAVKGSEGMALNWCSQSLTHSTHLPVCIDRYIYIYTVDRLRQ